MSADDAGLPVVRAADLDEPNPARRWLIEQLWSRAGVGIIGGAPKCWKSWLALDLAVSVASATPCLDTFLVAEPGGCSSTWPRMPRAMSRRGSPACAATAGSP